MPRIDSVSSACRLLPALGGLILAVSVAAGLGISAAAVRVARSRVLHRLRQELRGLLK